MENMEKIVEKIKNLLDLAGNNPNENEALAAALKAQELMAKYHVQLADVSGERSEKIVSELCDIRRVSGNSKWKVFLAEILAENFSCKCYLCGPNIVFYGYEKDAKIARDVFLFLYKTGVKLARKQYYVAKKQGRYTKYVMNTYLIGFCAGIKEVLGKQCTALMVVVPEKVKEGYTKLGLRQAQRNIRTSKDSTDYDQGVRDGKDTVNSRALEAS